MDLQDIGWNGVD